MKQILCLSMEPWSGSPGRTQQLICRIKDAQILYFSPAAGRLDRSFRQKGRRVRPNIAVFTLPPLLLPTEERFGRLFRMGQHRLSRFVAGQAARARFQEPLLWVTSPLHVHLLDHLDYGGLVYDCGREWDELPPAWEGALAQAADVVFAASSQLAERLAPCSSNIALLPNGVNHPMFCREGLPVPPELRGLRGPVLGYTGALWRDLDVTPVIRAALERPDWYFVFVGRDEGSPFRADLEELPNVLLLGRRPPVELPDYLGRFDVCLHLLRRRDDDSDIIPPRFYEYLSTGKPIVSMLFEDQVEPFPDVIYNAHTPQEFSRLCGRALEEQGDWARRRRLDYGAAGAWSRRADQVARILESIGLY